MGSEIKRFPPLAMEVRLIVRPDECERILPLFPIWSAAHCLAKPLSGFHHRFDTTSFSPPAVVRPTTNRSTS
jgi:hypothetical protein